jgi:transcriptional antiterminator Rof (Rho-off)
VSDYRPIACARYDGLEAAIVRGLPLRVRWRDEAGGGHEGVIMPLDLGVREGAEYLMARDGGGHPLSLRLDRIGSFGPVA